MFQSSKILNIIDAIYTKCSVNQYIKRQMQNNTITIEEITSLLLQLNQLTLNKLTQYQINPNSIFNKQFDTLRDFRQQSSEIQKCDYNRILPDLSSDYEEINQIQINFEFRMRLQILDNKAINDRNREKLFRRHRINQAKLFTTQIAQAQKQYPFPNDESSYRSNQIELLRLTHEMSDLNRQNRKPAKKQIAFWNRKNKCQKLIFWEEDLDKLKPNGDLNDNIIQNYLQILKHRILPEDIPEKIHIFSTHFFTKLLGPNYLLQIPEILTMKDIQNTRKKVQQNYKHVKRWTKNCDIFEKQVIVLPINAFNHWFAILILNPFQLLNPTQQKINYTEIIYCDSMMQKKQLIVQAVKQYLLQQLQQKKKISLKGKQQKIYCYQLLLPRQTNAHDCGLYMLAFIDQLLNKQKQLKNLHLPRNRDKLRLFPRRLIFTMRQRLIKLIQKLIPNDINKSNNKALDDFVRQKSSISQNFSDYDILDPQQFEKYLKLNIYLKKQKLLPKQQLEYCQLIRFYLDSEVNYYQKDLRQ